MNDLILYVHGAGVSAAESAHYRPLFPNDEVLGLDYPTAAPWEAANALHAAVEALKQEHAHITLIANSIGAFFSMIAGIDGMLRRAYLISPIVDMERLICGMMLRAGVTEAELEARGVIRADSGETLSWAYLCYVRSHPVRWTVPTSILCGAGDELTSLETVRAFAERQNADLTVMENGEHWFHTDEQMRFLDNWLRERERRRPV